MTQEPKALDLSKLSDVDLAVVIRNLRLLLDLHIDERFRRLEETGDRPEE
jgi:predicted nucleotidyltransferase